MLLEEGLVARFTRVNCDGVIAGLLTRWISVDHHPRHHGLGVHCARHRPTHGQRRAGQHLLARPRPPPHAADDAVLQAIRIAHLHDATSERKFAGDDRPIPRALDLLRAGMDPAGRPALHPIGRHGPQSLRWRVQEDEILRADLDAAGRGVFDLERSGGGRSAPRCQGNRGDERLITDVKKVLHCLSCAGFQSCFSMLQTGSR